jgi:hypothetical protein
MLQNCLKAYTELAGTSMGASSSTDCHQSITLPVQTTARLFGSMKPGSILLESTVRMDR